MNHAYKPTSTQLRTLFAAVAFAITLVLGAFIDQLAEPHGQVPVATWHQSSDSVA